MNGYKMRCMAVCFFFLLFLSVFETDRAICITKSSVFFLIIIIFYGSSSFLFSFAPSFDIETKTKDIFHISL